MGWNPFIGKFNSNSAYHRNKGFVDNNDNVWNEKNYENFSWHKRINCFKDDSNENLIYLDEVKDVFFLSLTNKIIKNPKNIISAGINARSQFNTINKFQKINELKKTIILIPKENYKEEIEKAIQKSKISVDQVYYYDTDLNNYF